MRRRAWLISGVVIVLAAAGAVTAVLVTGSSQDSGPDYKALPTCATLAPALPGPPTLTTSNDVPNQPLEHGLDPAFMDLQCTSADVSTYIAVDVYQPGSLDLDTAVQYADKTVHDSRSRAKAGFDRRSTGLDKLSSTVRYSSRAGGESMCTVTALKRNATVVLKVPVTGSGAASPDRFKAACRQIAEKQLPKVVDAALS